MNFRHTPLNDLLLSTPLQSMEGLIVINLDGYIQSCNERARVLLPIEEVAYQEKQFHHLFTYYTVEDLSPIPLEQTPFYISLTTGVDVLEKTVGIKIDDHMFIWLSCSSKRITDQISSYILISIIDVSKIINQHRQLVEKKHHLKLLVASLNDIVFEVTGEGVFINYWTNDPSLLFYEPKHFLNKNLSDLFPTEISKKTIALIKKSLADGISYKMDFQSPVDSHKNNWYNLQVKPIHLTQNRVALLISDITKSIESNEKIRFNEHKFNQAFHFSGLGMILTNIGGYCIEANKTLTKITGFSKKELSKMNFSDYIHPEDHDKYYQLRQKLICGEIESFYIEKRYRHKRGHYIWCAVTISTVLNQFQEVSFLISQLQDISEIKKNIETLKRQKKELGIIKMDLESKVQQLEEFNQIVAHNLRGPVSNIHMLIDQLRDEKNAVCKDEYLKLLKISNDNVSETLAELSEVLELRATQFITFKKCNFLAIYQQVINQFSKEIHRKKAILIPDFQAPEIYYPKIYLENILNNLLSNALKYTSKGKQPIIHIRTFKENRAIILSVQDNGIGIDLPKFKSHLFMFKKNIHRGFHSKGIGLFITRYQIESLGGKIDVQSEPEVGSTFLVKFSKK
ncbi:PAS domain S-box protein [Sphingobacterium sp. SRCM116780]|uniref:PAS domain-containing sensor histidine kinase n=1 Tax=Sphingobacterium sp. SRCM116780 TaxID=2907623 RepID=UPI001F366D29|nr:HAMP domain-containing sensor histidine kinase [Sphingobacterium sp. SRCM116780]UIR55284.1 PAS domain S-box protein [Sphingobacterium sp. SRCM116780]